jgi:hypothetical protein
LPEDAGFSIDDDKTMTKRYVVMLQFKPVACVSHEWKMLPPMIHLDKESDYLPHHTIFPVILKCTWELSHMLAHIQALHFEVERK